MRNLSRLAPALVLIVSGLAAPATAQTTTRVSVATGGGQATNYSIESSMSADGRYVAFTSAASNLVSGDTNGYEDVFVHDRQTGFTERVSVDSGDAQARGGDSDQSSISADGRFVAFRSFAPNLVADDTNGVPDIFVRDRQTATTTRVSVSAKGGREANGASVTPAISGDGRYVVFESFASNLVVSDFNNKTDIFLRDREAQTTVRVSVATDGAEANGGATAPSISGNGRVVVFESAASNLVSDTNNSLDVFARDLETGQTTRVSVGLTGGPGNKDSNSGTVSADGRFVAFTSVATNFDAAGSRGIYVHDRQTGQTTPLSVVPSTTAAMNVPAVPVISRDGRAVCYGQLLPSGRTDVFVGDRQTGTSVTVSLSTTGGAPNGSSANCAVNGDGKMVAFWSNGSNLVAGDTNGFADIFVRTFPSSMAVDKAALTFAAVTSGGTFLSQTAAQHVRLTQDGALPVAWTATSNQPWLQVSPASGTGTATLSVSVAPAGAPSTGTVTGTIFLSLTGAANTLSPIPVSLTLAPAGTTLSPFGSVDTPTENRTGVTGAVPFTGWALDDIEVTQVSICRTAFGAEVAPADPNCGGAAEIFVGFAVFIESARPDVAAAFPAYPLAVRAGWGFMVLTNMLPGQGNGTYTFRMRAFDRDGHVSLLGTRTMTCANASATLPFGTLDTPLQGGVASGSTYINFGWALTPLSKTIPVDGSTIHVLVDGIDMGTVDYNHARSDIQTLFPGLNNTSGAIGFKILNTTFMSNGLHTISWTVMDNAGAVEGIGSRFFTVSNGSSAVTATAMSTRAALDAGEPALDTTAFAGRRGWDLEASYEVFSPGWNGVTMIRSEEVNRVELQLGEGAYVGYLRTAGALAPLPIGSHLDAATNTFTWAPGVGFVGRYDFVFVRSLDGHAVSRREVRIVLYPKGRR